MESENGLSSDEEHDVDTTIEFQWKSADDNITNHVYKDPLATAEIVFPAGGNRLVFKFIS